MIFSRHIRQSGVLVFFAIVLVLVPARYASAQAGNVLASVVLSEGAFRTTSRTDGQLPLPAGSTGFRSQDTNGIYGEFSLEANGNWEYRLENGRKAVQALIPSDDARDEFQVRVPDGGGGGGRVVGIVRILITGVLEPVTGARDFRITEDHPGGETVSGRLDWELGDGLLDVDRAGGIWGPATMQGAFGALVMEDRRGNWHYTLNTNGANTQALRDGDSPVEAFTFSPDETDLYESVTFRITIEGRNDPPIVTMAQADQAIVRPGEVVRLSGAAIDIDNLEQDTLVYTWFSDPSTAGVFADRGSPNTTWTAPLGVVETAYTLSLRARDVHGGSGTATVVLDGDSAPVFGIEFFPPRYYFKMEQEINPPPLPAARGGDGVLSYSVRPSLPLGIGFNPHTRRLTGIPRTSLGDRRYTYRATDVNGDVAVKSFAITVYPTTFRPGVVFNRFVGGDLFGTVTPAFGERVTSGRFLLLETTGRTGPGFFVFAEQQGEYGTITIRAGGEWSYRVDHAAPNVVALRQGKRAKEIFLIQPDPSYPYTSSVLVIEITGTNENPVVNATANRSSAPAGGAIRVSGTAADADDGDLAGMVYSWSVSPASSGGSFVDRRARDATYLMGSRGVGAQYTLSLRATDAAGGVGTGSVVVTQGAREAQLGGEFNFSFTEDGDGGGGGGGGGGDDETKAGAVSHPLRATTQNGVYGEFEVRASDATQWRYTLRRDRAVVQALRAGEEVMERFRLRPVNGSVTGAFATVTISGANDPPVANVGEAPASSPVDVPITLSGSGSDADAGEQAGLVYAWSTSPVDFGRFEDDNVSAPHTVWTPAMQGVVTLRLRVEDAQGAVREDSMILTIGPGPPQLGGVYTGEVTEDAEPGTASGLLAYQNPLAGIDMVFNPQTVDGRYGVLVLAADGAWAYTLDDNRADLLNGLDSVLDAFDVQAGFDPVTEAFVTSAPDFIQITVHGVNDPPQLSITTPPASVQSTSEHLVTGSATDPDRGHLDALVYTWSTEPAGIGTFTDAAAKSTPWSAPSVDVATTVTLRLTARDPGGAVATAASPPLTINPVTPAGDNILFFATMDEMDPGTRRPAERIEQRLSLPDGFTAFVEQHGSSDFGRFDLEPNGEFRYIQLISTREVQQLVPGDLTHDDFTLRGVRAGDRSRHSLGILRIRILGKLEPVTGPRVFGFTENEFGDLRTPAMPRGTRVEGILDWDLGDNLLRVDRRGGIWNPDIMNGRFGVFEMLDERGNWRYILEPQRAGVQALRAGELGVDRIVVHPYTPLYEPVVFEFRVRGVFDVPTATAEADRSVVRPGEVVSLSGRGSSEDAAEREKLAFTWYATPAVGVFADRNALKTTWTAPQEMRDGSYRLVLRVRDTTGVTSESGVTLRADSAPYFGTDYATTDYVFQVRRRLNAAPLPAAISGSGEVRYKVTPALPAGLSFDRAARRLTGEPLAVLDQPRTYTYTAADANGETDTLQFTIMIVPRAATPPAPLSHYIGGDLRGTLSARGSSTITSPGTRFAVGTLRFFRPDGSPASDVGFEELEQEGAYGTFFLEGIRGQDRGFWAYRSGDADPATGNSIPPEALVAVPGRVLVREEFVVHSTRPDLYPPATVVIMVEGLNDRPSVKLTTNRSRAPAGTVINLGGRATDPDSGESETLSYTWSVLGVRSGSFSDRHALETTYTVGDRGVGSEYILVLRATDQNGGEGGDSTIITQTAAADTVLSGVLEGAVTEDAPDTTTGGFVSLLLRGVDRQGIYGRFRVVGGSAEWSYTLDSRLPSVQALAAGEQQQETFAISPRDSGVASVNVVITVTGVNDPLTAEIIAPADTVSVFSGETVTLSGRGNDPDLGDTLEYLWSASDGLGIFANAAVSETTWIAPKVEEETNIVLRLRVDDGRLSDTERTVVTVSPPPPQSALAFVGEVISEGNYIAGAAIAPRTLPVAIGGVGELRYAITPALPGGLSFDEASRVLSGTPHALVSGITTAYAYTVTDQSEGAARLTFDITVSPAGAAPGFQNGAAIPAQRYIPDVAITPLTLPAATGGDGALRYDIRPEPPSGLSFDAANRVLSGVPDTPQRSFIYYYTATDSASSSASLNFAIAVAVPDVPPVFADAAAIPAQSYKAREAITPVTLPEAAAGNGALRYHITPELPDGLFFDAASRVLFGTPRQPRDLATYAYTATDSDTNLSLVFDAALLRFTIVIAVEDLAPAFPNGVTIPDQEYTTNVSIPALNLPSGAGGDGALSYSLSPELPRGLRYDPERRRVIGTPFSIITDPPAPSTHTWTVTDEDGDTDTLRFVIRITVPPFTIIAAVGHISEDAMVLETVRGNESPGRHNLASWDRRRNNDRRHKYGRFTLRANGDWSFNLIPAGSVERLEIQKLGPGETLHADFRLRGFRSDGSPGFPGSFRIFIQGAAEPIIGPRNFTLNEDDFGDDAVIRGRLNWDYGREFEVERNGGIWNRETRNGRFGLFEMLDERGNWRYTLNPNAAITQGLRDGDAPRETFVLLPYTPLYESVTFGFTVTGNNDAPQVTMAQADRTVVQPGDVVRLRGAATDPDRLEQETLAYTWFTDPAMGVFDDSHDPNTNWHAPRTMPEDGFTFTLRVRDVRGAFDEAVLRLDSDSAPAFGTDYAPDAYIFKMGTAVDVAALPRARGGNGVVRYSLRPAPGSAAGRVLPRGLSFDAAARRLVGTPQVALSEAAAWIYVATDDNGDTDTLQFTIMVVPQTAPNPPSGSRYIGGPLYGTVTPAFGERTVSGVLSLNHANGRAADGGAFIEGAQDGDYGTLTVTDPSGGPGRWEYRVDHRRGDVNALRPGRRLREQFTITTNLPQVYPAATLVIDILGANRAPNVRVTANRSTAPVQSAILVSGTVTDTNDQDLAGVVYSWSVAPTALGGHFVDRRARDTIYVMGSRGAGAKYTLSLRATDQHGGVGTGNVVVTQIKAAGRLRGDFNSSFIEDGVKRTEFNVVSHDLSVRSEDGVYGRFEVLQRGLGWNYTLDGRRAAVQALGAGHRVQERFRLEPARSDISGAFATITITGVNDAPVAAITGAPASLAAGGAVTLDGGGSSDPDAGESATLDYAWSTLPLNTGVFDDARAARPVWTAATAPGGVTLRLRVTDAQGAAATATTGIRVTPAPAAIVAESAADRGGALREDSGPQALAGRLRYINPPDFAGFDAIFHARMQEGGYGVFVIAEDGAWTYTLNDNDALRRRDVVEDTFGVEAGLDLVSGNYANATPDDFIRITIRGQNDVPQVTVTTPAAALQSASAQVHPVAGRATDPDFGHQAALRYAWSTAPANIGVFANPNAASTTWTAPSVGAPLTVTLRFSARDLADTTGSGDSAVITVNPRRVTGDRILLFRTMDELDPGATNNRLTGRLDLSGFDSVVARDQDNDFSRFILRSNGEWEYIQHTRTRALQALVPDDIHSEDYLVRARPSDGSPVRTIGFLRFRIFGKLEPVTGPRTGAFNEDHGGDRAVVSGRLDWELGDGLLRVDRNGGIWNRETREGRFGTFVMENERGNWRYTLQGGRAQTQALVKGERPVERFVVAPYTPLYEPVIFEFTVEGRNDAPLVTARAGQVIVRAGDVVALSGAATDPDNPAIETLSYIWIANPAVGTFADRNSPVTTWTAPHEMREIIYTLRLRVRDSAGAAGEAVVRLDGDSVPFFGSEFVPRSFHFQAERRIDIAALPEARGGDAPLSYRITPQLPAGLSFDGGTRRLSGTPRSPLDTPTTYTYMATDRNGDAATADFTLRIAPATATAPPPSSRYISGDLHVQVTDATGKRVVRGEFQLRLPNGAETTDERYIGRGSRQLVRTNYLTGHPEGRYGTLDLNEIGEWSYTLDGNRPAVMALGQGERVRDEFTIRTDRSGLYPPTTLVVEVIGSNNAPSARVTADRNQAPAGTVINLRGVGGDADSGDKETLSYTWSLNPVSQGGRFGDRSARDTTWTVGNRGPGAQYTLRLRVTDQGGAFGSDTVVITQVAAQVRVLSGVLQGGVTEDGDATISGAVSEALRAVDERGAYGRFRVVGGATEWSYTLDSGPAVQRLAAGQQVREKRFAITPQDTGIAAAAVTITVTGANDPPTAEITAPAASVTVMPGDVVTLSGDGADIDAADALFFLWSVTGERGEFSDLSTARTTWTAPQVAVPTDFVVTFKVSDGRLSDTDLLAVAVTPPPVDAAPVFVARSVLDQSYTRGATITPLSLPQAVGGNGELIYTLRPEPLPQGLSFDSLTRILFGTPQVSQPLATYTYTVVDGDANNNPTDADTLRFTITIPDAGINRGTPAFLAAAPDRTYTTGAPIIPLDLPAAAGGSAPLRYTLEPDLPAGLIFDALARRVSGTPQALSPSTTYTYTVTDALEATDTLDFDLSVEAPPDVAPVFAAGARIADQEYAVDTGITALRLPGATNGNGALRYGIAPPLPDGLSFDDGTRMLSGAPTTPQDALTYTYTAVDTDDNEADTDRAVLRFTISVDGVPDFGAQGIAAQQYIAARAIASLTLPAASGGNGLLVYALPNLPDGLIFDGATRVLSGTPAAASERSAYVYAVVDSDSNRGAADRDVLRFTIMVLPPSAISGVPDGARLVEDGAESELQGTLGIISPPGGDATFVAHDDTGGDYGTFTLTTAGAWRYRLDDRVQALAGDAVASESFTVVANADPALTARIEIMLSGVNDPPTATISAPAANTQLAFGGRLSLNGGGSDPDSGDSLEYTWSTMPAGTGSFDDERAAVTMWTAPDSAVTVTLQLEVSDGRAAATASVTGITVAPITISGVTTGAVTEDGTAAETMTGDTLTVNHPAADGDTTFVPQTDADGAYGLFGISTAGEWTYQLGGNADNEAAVNALTASARPTETFTVAANADNNVTQDITITITGANDQPTATISTPVTGTSAMFDEVITVTGSGADPDTGEAATLTYMWTTVPTNQGSFAAPNAASTTWTAGAQAINNTVTLSLTVTDTSAAANASHSATVAVTVMMTPLVISGTATGTVTEDGNAAAMMTGNTLTITNSNPGNDVTFVTRTGVDGTYGLFGITAQGVWTYTLGGSTENEQAVNALGASATPTDTFTVMANDDNAVTQSVTITVTGANDAPTATISAPAANTQLAFGGRLSLSGSGSDPDNGDSLEYTWSTTPANTGSFDDDSAAATMWTAPDSDVTVTLQLEVSDGRASDTASVTGITVAPITISGVATGAVTEDGTAAETMTGDTLTVSHPAADGDTTFVPQTDADGTYGLFGISTAGEWTYTLGGNTENVDAVNALGASARPTDTFTVAANADNSITREIIVTITGANDQPTATISAPVTGTSAMFDEVITVTGSGADPDDGETATLIYAWTTTPANQGSFAAPSAASTTWTAGAQVIDNTVTLSLTVTDTSGAANASHSATVAVTVMMTPLVIGGTATGTVTEDGNAAAMMTGNTLTITNPNPGNDLSFVTRTGVDGTYGLFGITAQGVWTYTLGGNTENEQAVNALGASATPTDTFTVMANDDNAVTQSVTITVTGANDPPTATISAPAANTQLAFGGRLSLNGGGSDPDNGDSLEYTWSTIPAGTGSFDDERAAVTMWTAPDSAVTVTLQLEVSDGSASDTASVTGITVAPITISGVATGAVTEDGTAAETMTGDTLTVNHPEAGGDTTFVPQTDTDGAYGLFGISTAGEWTYTLGGNTENVDAVNALGASARPTETFTVAANADSSVTQNITITVTGANDRPTATISAPVTGTSAMFDEVITVTGSGADPDTGETASLTYMWTTTPANQGSFAAPNAASTTWTAGAQVIDNTVTLSLTVTDTSGAANASHSATVAVTVMMTPLVIGGTATGTVTEDGNAAAMMTGNTLTITNPNPGNDVTFVTQTDADGDYGLFGITAQGVWTYTLGGNPANEQAVNALRPSDTPTDTFTVAANDDNNVTESVTITVTGANDPPTATISAPPANTMAVFGGQIVVTGAGSDPDTGVAALQYAWSTTPANTGSFANANAAATTWTAPDSGTATSVTLNLMVSDGAAATAATPVIIMVVPLAFTGDTTGALTEDSGPATATGALTIDNPAGGSEEFVAEDLDGTYGLFSIGANGSWTYTIGGNADNIAAVNALAAGDAMDDVLTATSVVGPATRVTITITGTNDAPTAAISAPADGMDVEFGVVVTVTGSTSSDPDTGATLTYAWSTQPPDRGSFADAAAASTTWTASESGAAAVTLILTVTDDATPPATDTARVTVNPVAVEADFGGVITGTVVEAGTSAGAATATGTLTVTTGSTNKNVVAQTGVPGTYGRFSIAANRAWTYTLDDTDDDTNALAAGATAEDTFTVTASVNPAATVDVTLTITGANDAPEVTISEPDAGNVLSGRPVTLRAAATDPDTGNNALTYQWSTTPPGEGSFTDDARPDTTWTAPTLDSGTMDVTLTLTVTDDARATAAATVALTVEQPAVAGPGIDTTTNPAATPLVLDEEGNRASGGIAEGTLTVTNAASETPTHRITRQPLYGTVTLNAQTRNVDESWTYTLDNNRPATKEHGPDDFDTDSFGIQTTIGDITIDSVITITLNTGVFPDDPPTATATVNDRAGASATVEEGAMVTLTGGGTDPDSDDSMISYQWAHAPPQIVTFTPENGRAPMVTFMAPEERTTLRFTLTATSEGRPSPELAVTVRVGRSQFDNVHRTILPEVTRAMVDTTVSAIARRVEHAATKPDASAATFSLGGQSTLADMLQSNGEALNNGTFNVKSLLGRSAFALPLNQAGGPLAGVTLWGNGAYRNLSGKSATVDWDGDLFGATVGGDAQLTDTLLTGLAVSWADGTFDYTDSSSGADEGRGTYQATLTSLHPYISTSLLDGQVTLWATGGYGWGEIEITDTADPTAEGTVTADTRLATAAVGGAGSLLNQPGLLTPDGTTTVRVKAEALTTAIKAEQQGDRLAGLTTDARRLRLTLEGSHDQPLLNGAQLTPSVGVGLRHDAGDGRTGTGAEISGGLVYAYPALRLTMESRGRVLLAHGGDYEDWSVSGRVTLAPGMAGQGLAVTLAPTYQTTTSASGLAQLWEQGTANRPAPSGPTTPQGLMEATVAYGLPVGDHLLAPYGGMTLGAADARTYRLGSRVRLAHRLNMSLEGARKGATASAPVDHGVRLQLEWNW